MKKVAFYTLGCKVNAYDSAFMQALFLDNGYNEVPFGDDADIIVINTCTVTATADKKSRAAIRRAARTGKVIVSGCMAQKNAQKVLDIDGVSAAIGTDDRGDIVRVAERLLAGEDKIDATHGLDGCGFEPMRVVSPGTRTRSVIKIQEGCNNFCSYCIIPYVRGRSRSRSFDDIAREAASVVDGGVRELVLTGIHIASYEDGGKKLGDVITALDQLGVRIRLGSIEPGILDEAFVEQAAKADNLCPHFHLSLQSGSADVLGRMNRKYTPKAYMAFVSLLRQYFDHPAVTTDVITGFPGETEGEYEETMRFVEEAAFSRIHVFPFSAREGTKAYGMTPKIPKRVAKDRAAELIALGQQCEQQYLQSMIGRQDTVLFEEPSDVIAECMEGYSTRYVRVAAKASQNEIKTVTLSQICGTIMRGQMT